MKLQQSYVFRGRLAENILNFNSVPQILQKLIQSIISNDGSDFDITNKITIKAYSEMQQYLNSPAKLKGINEKIFERFFLRVNQFLEYRLCELKNHNEIFIRNEVLLFQKKLNNVLAHRSDQPQLSQLLREILNASRSFALKLLNKLALNANKLSINKQSVLDVQIFIKNKFPDLQKPTKNFQSLDTKSFYNEIKNQGTPNISRMMKIQSAKSAAKSNLKGYIDFQELNLPIIASSKLQNNLSIISEQTKYNSEMKCYYHQLPTNSLSFSHISSAQLVNIHNKRNGNIQLHPQSFVSKKQAFRKLTEIIQLAQDPFIPVSNDYLFNQLKELNKKNQMMITKFRKRFIKRRAKSQRHVKRVSDSITQSILAEKNTVNEQIQNVIIIEKSELKQAPLQLRKKKLPLLNKRNTVVH